MSMRFAAKIEDFRDEALVTRSHNEGTAKIRAITSLWGTHTGAAQNALQIISREAEVATVREAAKKELSDRGVAQPTSADRTALRRRE